MKTRDLKYYRTRYPKIKRKPFLSQFLSSIAESFVTMNLINIVLLIPTGLFESNSFKSIAEISSYLTFSIFIIGMYYLPVNIIILVFIQKTKIIPFILYSRVLVCVETIIFFLSSIMFGELIYPKVNFYLIISAILIIILSIVFRFYALKKHKRFFRVAETIIRHNNKYFKINREVDTFIFVTIIILLVCALKIFI